MKITEQTLLELGWEKHGNIRVLRSTPRLGWYLDTYKLIVGYTEVPFPVTELEHLYKFLEVFNIPVMKLVNVDNYGTKSLYLVKLSGSMGSVYDFSRCHLYNADDIRIACDRFGEPFGEIKYSHYDERIGFHAWNVLSVNGHHMMWIYSTTNEHPHLSEWSITSELI